MKLNFFQKLQQLQYIPQIQSRAITAATKLVEHARTLDPCINSLVWWTWTWISWCAQFSGTPSVLTSPASYSPDSLLFNNTHDSKHSLNYCQLEILIKISKSDTREYCIEWKQEIKIMYNYRVGVKDLEISITLCYTTKWTWLAPVLCLHNSGTALFQIKAHHITVPEGIQSLSNLATPESCFTHFSTQTTSL